MQTTPVDLRAKRLVQALVFAAKSDGHIDADEQRAIDHSLAQLQVGRRRRAGCRKRSISRSTRN